MTPLVDYPLTSTPTNFPLVFSQAGHIAAPPILSAAELVKKQQQEASGGLALVAAPTRVLKPGEFRVSAVARARWDKVGDPPYPPS